MIFNYIVVFVIWVVLKNKKEYFLNLKNYNRCVDMIIFLNK